MKTPEAKGRVVATAVRMERDDLTDDVFLVFKVLDESFKQRVRKDWEKDIPMKLVGRELVEE